MTILREDILTLDRELATIVTQAEALLICQGDMANCGNDGVNDSIRSLREGIAEFKSARHSLDFELARERASGSLRFLKARQTVDHINGDYRDNSPENLRLVPLVPGGTE